MANKRLKFNWLALGLLFPVMFFLAAFTFYPFVKSVYLSFYATDSLGKAGTFIGLKMWKKVLTSFSFKNSIFATLKFAAVIGVGTFSVAMINAFLCVNRTKVSSVYETVFSIPIAVASAPLCAIATYIFCRYGIFNGITGQTKAWLAEQSASFWITAFVTIWGGVGSSFLYLLVGFRNVPNELLECAELDGCKTMRKFFKIYIPIASPQIFFVVFLNILSAFKSFAIIHMLVGPETDTNLSVLMMKIYLSAFVGTRYETACIYAIVLSVLIFLVSRIQFKVEKKVVYYQ